MKKKKVEVEYELSLDKEEKILEGIRDSLKGKVFSVSSSRNHAAFSSPHQHCHSRNWYSRYLDLSDGTSKCHPRPTTRSTAGESSEFMLAWNVNVPPGKIASGFVARQVPRVSKDAVFPFPQIFGCWVADLWGMLNWFVKQYSTGRHHYDITTPDCMQAAV